MFEQDTIAAIATGMSNAGIGIVRISGPEAFAIGEKIFRPKNAEKILHEQKAYTVHYGNACDENEVLDEVLCIVMKAPHSYTAEDTIEINCHGGMLVTKKVLEAAIHAGARIADPGEFTKRAFLNGRIDLSQAEAVMDLIEAKNDMALKSSVSQLRGSVRKKVEELRAKILYETAFIETALDDPEHISLDGYPEKLRPIVEEVLFETEKLLASSENGKMLKEGVKTVILGKPNAGKSSLLNALLGEERAIVTDIAGTTRDILEEHMQMRSVSMNILDTAGIRQTGDTVEKIGVERAKSQAEDADLILYVADASAGLSDEDKEIIPLLKEKNAIVLLNKSDMDTVIDSQQMKEEIANVLSLEAADRIPIMNISAKTEEGLHQLEDCVNNMFFNNKLSYNDQIYITSVRQKINLEETRDSLKMVLQSIDDMMPEDFFSIDLIAAYNSLGSIIGEALEENLVNEIFSKFCMGK